MRFFNSVRDHQLSVANELVTSMPLAVPPRTPISIGMEMHGRKAEDDEGQGLNRRQRDVPYQMYEAIRQQRITYFYLSQGITDPEYFTDIIHRLYTAAPQDIIYLHLNCPGGRLDTGVQIINAMKESEARIVAVLDSKAYSLGTLMFLAADEFVIHDNCMFMIHNYSGGVGGKGNEQVAELHATVEWFKKLAHKYYSPFLSKEEIANVLDGKDMWMESDEIKRRLRAMVAAQQAAANGDDDEEAPKKAATKKPAAKKAAAKKPAAKKPATKRSSAKKPVAAVVVGELPPPTTVAVPVKPVLPGRGRRTSDK